MSAETWSPAVVGEYEQALRNGAPMTVHDCSGAALPFEIERWLREPDAADETLLDRCDGPTLDIGCGPGRLVAALNRRGVVALGVDVAEGAVAIARASGARAIRRSIFDRVPAAGRWRVALLADGNIGIGGDVGALLSRLGELLAVGGNALIEVDPADADHSGTARITDGAGSTVASFPWARVGSTSLMRLSQSAGLAPVEEWVSHGRAFVRLRRI